MKILHELAAGVQDVVAPARCMECMREGSWHCHTCRQEFRQFPLQCIVCERKHPRGLTCERCRDDTSLRGVVSAGSYRSMALRRGIHWLKFKHVRAVANPLARLLAARLTTIAPLEVLAESSALVPIPLHRRRQRQRGFNQSEDIAGELSTMTGIPVVYGLARGRSTMTQSKLPKELRQQNTAGAFVLASEAKQSLADIQIIILIDDVATTGSTLSAAAVTIASAAPADAQVWAATIARG